ncbi:MAG: hypothetical protein AAGF87_09850 [Bacteroidota bacterium]
MEKAHQTTAQLGIQFMTDTAGNRVAAVIDIEKHGELLEELFDIVISQNRMSEDEFISLREVKKELEEEGKL